MNNRAEKNRTTKDTKSTKKESVSDFRVFRG